MSKYTYHISFNSSDYFEVYPETPVKITGFWEDDSWIDRIETDEIKIHREGNETVYGTLAANIIDHTTYNTEYFFKIQKSAVDWKTFVFGIRWGTINTEICVYTFKPTAYDSYYKYWDRYIDDLFTWGSGIDLQRLMAYNQAAPHTYYTIANDSGWVAYRLFDVIELGIANLGNSTTVKSTLLHEDSSTVVSLTAVNGIYRDYVTNYDNYFKNAALYLYNIEKKTTQDLIELLEMFQVYPFFESDNVVRIEHVKYLLTQLQDNAVSLTLEDDEADLEFLNENLPYKESLALGEKENNTDTDFTEQFIKYSNASVGFVGAEIQNSYNINSNYDQRYLNASDYTSTEFIVAAERQNVLIWIDPGGDPCPTSSYYNDTHNSFDYTFAGIGGSNINLISNHFAVQEGHDYTTTIVIGATGASNIKACLYYTAITTPASLEAVLSLGANNVTFTANYGIDIANCSLRISFDATDGNIYGYATVNNPADANDSVVAQFAGAKSTTNKVNGPFSQANIINNWWNIYRPTNAGTLNGVAKTFTNSQYIISRQLKSRYWPNDINMQYGINDGTHIAKINRYERDLDSDFVTFELLYQEYE